MGAMEPRVLDGWRAVEAFADAEPAGLGYTPAGHIPLALAWTGEQLITLAETSERMVRIMKWRWVAREQVTT